MFYGALGVLFVQPPIEVGQQDHLHEAFDRLLVLLLTDWEERLYEDEKLVVYLGKYGYQDMDKTDRWARSKLIRRARILSGFMEEERKAARSEVGG